MMTPWAPAHSAVRITAPRLWGSESSSQTTERGGSPLSRAGLEEVLHRGVFPHGGHGHDAWWAWVRLMASACGGPPPPARPPAAGPGWPGWRRGRSTSPLRTKTLSMGGAGRRASATALRPSMIPSAPGSGRLWAGAFVFHRGYSDPGRVGRRKKFLGKGAENLHILCIIPWIPGKRKPLPPGIFGRGGGIFSGFHNFLHQSHRAFLHCMGKYGTMMATNRGLPGARQPPGRGQPRRSHRHPHRGRVPPEWRDPYR